MLYGDAGNGRPFTNHEHRRTANKDGTVERLEEIPLDGSRPDRTTRISTLASAMVCLALVAFLRENQDVFAWSHEDMPGIDLSVMVHQLNVSPSFPPVH